MKQAARIFVAFGFSIAVFLMQAKAQNPIPTEAETVEALSAIEWAVNSTSKVRAELDNDELDRIRRVIREELDRKPCK